MSEGEPLDGPQSDIRQLRSMCTQLPANEKAVFALACAERTVRAVMASSAQAMADALEIGWSAALGGPGDCVPVHAVVRTRGDLEQDEVAVVFYALGAVLGHADDAWWAATRAMDAAFARGERVPRRRGFLGRAKSEPDEAVTVELQWQYEALEILSSEGASAAAVARLRVE